MDGAYRLWNVTASESEAALSGLFSLPFQQDQSQCQYHQVESGDRHRLADFRQPESSGQSSIGPATGVCPTGAASHTMG